MEFTLISEFKDLGLLTWICLGTALIMTAVLISVLARSKKAGEPPDEIKKSATRALVYGALCVALSFLLSYIKLFSMPQGGSITLASVLPLALYAYRFGPKYGIIAGMAAGVLQFIQQPEVYHPVQPFLDYVLAFGCFGLAGYFRRSLPLGLIVGGIGRILFSTLSGGLFFYMYAPEGMNPWIYSVAYNTVVLGPDVLLCAFIAVLPPVKKLMDNIMK
ncbi:MAG: Thiamine transporter ThiT [Firmicutes bacterium ADurb.Bin182]|nr:MAG: Thiamine transporter ThiT [Firmicutes bacterium ADurb.Bin182]